MIRSSISVSLPALLDVLDRATAYQQVTPDKKSELLLAAAQAADPDLTMEALSKAVKDHLSQDAVGVEDGDVGAPVAFGWRRPKNQEAWARKQRQYHWLSWFGKDATTRELAFYGFMPLLVGMMGLVLAWLNGGSAPIMGISFVMGIILMAMVVGIAVTHLIPGMESPMDEVELGKHRLKACLKSPRARSYLRTLVASDLPIVLQGDAVHLQRLVDQDEEERDQVKLAQSEAQRDGRLALERAKIQQALRSSQAVS